MSRRTGTVLAACIGDHGGSYIFDVYRDGRLVRSLDNARPQRGTALPEETAVDVSQLDDAAILVLWKAFGLTDFFEGTPTHRVFSTLYLDHIPRTKPWWRFW